MIKFRTAILAIILTLNSQVLLAHSEGHGQPAEPVTKQEAEQAANYVLDALLDKEAIEVSWSEVSVSKSEKKEFSGQMEWVVSYHNESASDPAKRTLYIFLTLGGKYIAANYTGE